MLLRLLEKLQGEFRENGYHSHLGEINQTLLGEVGRPLLDERQVSEVHTQVGNTRRVTAIRAGGKRGITFKGRIETLTSLFSPGVAFIYFFSVSLRFLNLPSDDTVFCSLSISAFV